MRGKLRNHEGCVRYLRTSCATMAAMTSYRVIVRVEPGGSDAAIQVAGQAVTGDTITIESPSGFASVAVTAPGYLPFRKIVELASAETTVEVKLRKLPSQRKKPMTFVLLALVVLAVVKLVTSCR